MFRFFFTLLLSFQFCSAEIIEDKFHRAENHAYRGFTHEKQGDWTGPFFFIQMADCQLGMIEKNISWDKEIFLLKQAVDHINRLKPKFVIVCGDLTNAKPFKPAYDEQVADYKRIMSRVSDDIPLVCICGNHDVGNKPKKETIASYEEHFGSHYLSFWVGGVQCFGLNSSLIFNPRNAPDIYEEQKAWIHQEMERTFALNPKHRIVFTHHPWFLIHPKKLTFPIFEIPVERRIEMLDLFLRQNVTICFAGHYHRNAYGLYQGMEMVTTAALGKPLGGDRSGFRVVKVFEDRIEHDYFGLDEMPVEINLKDN